MRRWLFFGVVMLLLELFTLMTAKGVYWLVKPYFPSSRTLIMVATFIISNAMLATLFFGLFRFGMGWLAVLWLIVMAMILTFVVGHGMRLAGFGSFNDGMGLRMVGVACLIGLVAMALYNAYTPVARHLTIQIDKPLATPVKIAVTSDLHLGTLFGARQLHQLADILERENVDALLMAGDIMDDDTHVYDEQNMRPAFEAVVAAAKGNVIASLGNHDLYNVGQRYAIATAIRQTGTLLLDDKVAQVSLGGTPFTFIGRFDDHASNRLTTAKLIAHADTTTPVILLDHRPSQIDENVKHPIDLQVSGHTHNGQIFPANFIVKAINRVAYGHEQINGTHVLVSSGYGFWGVPFRLGSQSEVWVVHIQSGVLANHD